MRKTVFVLLAMALVPAMAFATDGQVLINQATLDAAGGTYPITSPGSYKLSGNLQAKDLNTDVIVIAADHATIDLNGFAILGTNDCSGGFDACRNAGSGSGITTRATVRFNVTIRNGTIQGMGRSGIFFTGDGHLVEDMHVRSNGSSEFVWRQAAMKKEASCSATPCSVMAFMESPLTLGPSVTMWQA